MNLWTRLGLSVAFSAGFYILMVEVLQKWAQFQTHKMQCILGLLGAGAVLALLGLASGKRSSGGGTEGDLGRGAGANGYRTEGGRIFTLPYCGCMLMVFGLITLMITPSARSQALSLARALTTRTRVAARPPPAAPMDNALAGFRLQGIIYRPSNPSAVINGQPVFVGDTVAGATVKTITTDGVVLAWRGREVVLTLSGPVAPAPQGP